MPQPKIGSYKKQPEVQTPAKSLVEGVQADLGQQIEESKDIVEASKSYEEILKEAEISLDDAQSIVDDMLLQGYYEESYPLTKRVSVTFRTRTQADYVRYSIALEAISPKFVDQLQELMVRYFLAGSLVRFGDQNLPYPDRTKENLEKVNDAFDKRLEWIESQPERIVALLAQKLNKFDKKVAVVLSEGVANFF